VLCSVRVNGGDDGEGIHELLSSCKLMSYENRNRKRAKNVPFCIFWISLIVERHWKAVGHEMKIDSDSRLSWGSQEIFEKNRCLSIFSY
jgi:hypothetical protein